MLYLYYITPTGMKALYPLFNFGLLKLKLKEYKFYQNNVLGNQLNHIYHKMSCIYLNIIVYIIELILTNYLRKYFANGLKL